MTLFEEIKNGLNSAIEANENGTEMRSTEVSCPNTDESDELKEN